MYKLVTNNGNVHIKEGEEIVMFHNGERYKFHEVVVGNTIAVEKKSTGELTFSYACVFQCHTEWSTH